MIINRINSTQQNRQNFGMALKVSPTLSEDLARRSADKVTTKGAQSLVDTFDKINKTEATNALYDLHAKMDGKKMVIYVTEKDKPEEVAKIFKTNFFFGPKYRLNQASEYATVRSNNYDKVKNGINSLNIAESEMKSPAQQLVKEETKVPFWPSERLYDDRPSTRTTGSTEG